MSNYAKCIYLEKNLHCGSYCTPTVSLPILLTSHALFGSSSVTEHNSNSVQHTNKEDRCLITPGYKFILISKYSQEKDSISNSQCSWIRMSPIIFYLREGKAKGNKIFLAGNAGQLVEPDIEGSSCKK